MNRNNDIAEESHGNFSNEFAAMSLGTTNDIHFSTYALSSFPEISTDLPFALSSVVQGYNTALDSACTPCSDTQKRAC